LHSFFAIIHLPHPTSLDCLGEIETDPTQFVLPVNTSPDQRPVSRAPGLRHVSREKPVCLGAFVSGISENLTNETDSFSKGSRKEQTCKLL